MVHHWKERAIRPEGKSCEYVDLSYDYVSLLEMSAGMGYGITHDQG